MEQEFLKKVDEIVSTMHAIEQKVVKLSPWRSFFNGIMSGIGSIIGVALALALVGWLLNLAGVIPAFQRQVDDWRQILNQTQGQKLRSNLTTGEGE